MAALKEEQQITVRSFVELVISLIDRKQKLAKKEKRKKKKLGPLSMNDNFAMALYDFSLIIDEIRV